MGLRIDVTSAGLRQLHHRIEQQHLDTGDWPIVAALVSNLIAREDAKYDRLLAKIQAERAAAAAAAEGGDDHSDVIDVDHKVIDEIQTANNNDVAPDAASPADDATATNSGNKGGKADGKKHPGHGRNGAKSYTKAQHLFHALAAGIIGAICAACGSGRMTRHREQIIIRVIGQPMFGAELHHAEQARCRVCGRVVTALLPTSTQDGLGKAVTYHWSACAMLIVLHYFSGLPFKRLESLHQSWGIPFADANQWDIASGAMQLLAPLLRALERYAIQNALNLRMDDTGSMILTIQKQINAELEAAKALGISEKDIRTGINATGFYVETSEAVVLLYYTGRHHAGEILSQLLKHRLPGSRMINKVTDGASKNFDHEHADMLISGVCNVHAFLKFHDIKGQYPAEYAVVGEAYDKIYEADAICRDRKMSPDERLAFHQQHSRPWMEKVKKLCEEKVISQLVEPRAPLWEPIHFFINQWPKLTKFLEVAGMPLDTNLCEQSLIAPVRYLAASFNFHTKKGAEVGDGGMSLTATARANDTEPVTWLTHCLANHADLAKNPEKYFPWVYRDRPKAQQTPPSKPPDPIQ